jgi:hypothetical protein
MWAKAQIVAFNVDSFPRIVAINLGRKLAMIAGYGDYDCRPRHISVKRRMLKTCKDEELEELPTKSS